MRANSGQSRKQIANNTRLSAATVTQITAQLLDEGIIVESGEDTQAPSQSDANGIASSIDVDHTGDAGVTKNRSAPHQARDTAPPEPGEISDSDLESGELSRDRSRRYTRRGRPQVVLELTPDAAMVAIVTVNFEWIEITLFNYTGSVLQQLSSPVSQATLSGSRLLESITATLQQTLNLNTDPSLQLTHITVACRGKVSRNHGKLLWSPQSRSEVISIGSHLQSRFNVGVTVDNDCNMIASALYRSLTGFNKDSDAMHEESDTGGNFAAVLVSYGIGLGFIHNGTILTGSRSSGTELGHMQIAADGPLCRCGKRGCIEAYAANYGIARRVYGSPIDQLDNEMINQATMQKIFAAAHKEDGIERLALREAGTAIGHGLANLFAIFDSFPARLVGLDKTTATIVANAINEQLLDAGDNRTGHIVSVHSCDSESELVRRGAVIQCLDYVDRQVFSYGLLSDAVTN